MKATISFFIINFFILIQIVAQTPIDKTKPVGAIAGAMDVSSTGAATYAIPIAIPPGTGGMQPQLSIIYNSQGGNGLLGVGWELAGLSAISRVPKPIENSNAIKPMIFTMDDEYALDGNRLILVDGVAGMTSAVYHTEVETFARISIIERAHYGATAFKAETKDGRILFYGNSADSKIEAQGSEAILFWRLTKQMDKNGNYIYYHYEKNATGESWIKEILYTGNDTTDLKPYNTLKFYYENRLDSNTVYLSGKAVSQTKLLDSIQVWAENAWVKTYRFRYQVDFYTHLTQVDEAVPGGAPVNPTLIAWGNATPTCTTAVSPYVIKYSTANYFGDFNGDGKTDIVEIPTKGLQERLTSHDIGYVWFANPDGNTFTLGFGFFLRDDFDPYGVQVADFNGDGKDDLLPRAKIQSGNIFTGFDLEYYYWMAISTGTNFTNSHEIYIKNTHEPMVGNFRGEGKADFLLYKNVSKITLPYMSDFKLYSYNPDRSYKTSISRQQDSIFKTADKFIATDFNGNGLQEVCIIGDTCVFYEFDRNTETFKLVFSSGYPTKQHEVFTGDFNGDGKTDLLTFHKDSNPKWEMHYSTGTGFTWPLTGVPLLNTNPAYYDSYGPINIKDFNGDGKDDILETHLLSTTTWDSIPTTFRICYSKGNGLFETETTTLPTEGGLDRNLKFGDFNGDGKQDVFLLKPMLEFTYTNIWFHKDEKKHLVKSIRNGLGIATEIEYKPLGNAGNSYSRNIVAQFPAQDFQGALHVVTKLSAPDGVGGNAYTTYYYEGARLHRLGKGFLGFTRIISTHYPSGLKTESTYLLNETYWYPYLFVVTNYAENTKLSITTYENNVKTFSNKRYFPFTSGIYNTDVLNDIAKATLYTYDNNGNMTNSSTYHPYTVAQTTQAISYTRFGEEYKPTQVTTTQNVVNVGQHSQTTHYTYNAKGRLLVERQYTSADTSKNITTRYEQYNALGLPTKITTVSSEPVKGGNQIEEIRTYDPSNRFVTGKTNALGHTSQFTYESKSGKLLSETDPNGLTTTYQYDARGRLTKTTFPDGSVATQAIHWYGGTRIPHALYYTEQLATAAPPVYTFYDALGREVCTYTRSDFEGAQNMYADTRYNAKGQVEKKSMPYRSIATAETNKKWTSYTYDHIGRLTEETGPMLHKSYSYTANKKTVTDLLNGNATCSSKTNNLGQVTESTDPGGSITYTYNAQGLPVTTKVNGLLVATMQYDYMGNRISLIEPNSGTTTSKYDAFGRLIKQTHARGDSTTYSYDLLGRVTQKLVNGDKYAEGSAGYFYDENKKYGIVSRVESLNHNTTYVYDDLCRVTAQTETILGEAYTTRYEYNSQGQVSKLIYPGGFYVTYQYNGLGELHVIRNPHNNIIWSMTKKNVFGQPTQYHWGEGRTTLLDYDSYGNLTGIRSGLKVANGGGGMNTNSFSGFIPGISDYPEMAGSSISCNGEVQYWTYGYNGRGMLESSGCQVSGQEEIYQYDHLNRLVDITSKERYNRSIEYNASGNILNQSHMGSYSYGSKPHAVTTVDPLATSSSSWECNTSYTPFNKIKQITKGDTMLTFTYGNDQQRINTLESGFVKAKSRTFVNKFFEKAVFLNAIGQPYQYLNYIYADNCLVGIYVQDYAGQSQGNFQTMYYVHTDRLGSYDVITDSVGTILERFSFDAWGNRRNPLNWEEADPNAAGHLFTRGYTGHEHLDRFGLINMNGRLYDPLIARFLSPDPFVPDAANTQDYNRYSYARNNPLMYTDPSGEFWHLVVGAAIGGILNWSIHGGQLNAKGLGYFGVGALAGALSAGVGAGFNGAFAGKAFGASFLSGTGGLSSTGFYTGFTIGYWSGATSGIVSGMGNGLIGNNSFGAALWNGFDQAFIQSTIGAVTGGIIGGIDAVKKHVDFFTGIGEFDVSQGVAASGDLSRIKGVLKSKYVATYYGENIYETSEFLASNSSDPLYSSGVYVPYKGIVVGTNVYPRGAGSAFPLGNLRLIQHEFGHGLQFRILGLDLYLRVVAKESLSSAIKNPGVVHENLWTETWANYLSSQYFGTKYLPSAKYPVKNIDPYNSSRLLLKTLPMFFLSPFL